MACQTEKTEEQYFCLDCEQVERKKTIKIKIWSLTVGKEEQVWTQKKICWFPNDKQQGHEKTQCQAAQLKLSWFIAQIAFWSLVLNRGINNSILQKALRWMDGWHPKNLLVSHRCWSWQAKKGSTLRLCILCQAEAAELPDALDWTQHNLYTTSWAASHAFAGKLGGRPPAASTLHQVPLLSCS